MSIGPSQMNAWRAFLESHAFVLRRLERELADETGLPLTWYDVLFQLKEHGGRIRIGELAEELLVSRSATTRFVDRLERSQLITREPCAEDRRGTWVVLTDDGLAALRSAAPVHLRGVQRYFSEQLTGEEAEALAGLLGKLVQPARQPAAG
ncbi:MAG: MarR family transcriptional regulator [Acidimicrobiia bacterium]|nr:MarR family transcriptional regulator [Acidimicrobiia bacterium]